MPGKATPAWQPVPRVVLVDANVFFAPRMRDLFMFLHVMAGMLLAMLTGDQATASKMSKIQPAFTDCLPELVRR